MNEDFALAVAAHQAGDFETARRGYEAALPKRNAFKNLGVLCGQLGRHAEAEGIFRLVLEQYPDDLEAQYGLADALLATGQFAEGWPLHEARRQFTQNTVPPETNAPEWLGGPVAGRRIVVCGEQGFGDQIQFARYVWALRSRGAEVTFATHPALCRLFHRQGLVTAPFSPGCRQIPACDAWVFVCSLPLRLGLPEPIPPVRLSPACRGGRGVGVVTTGGSAHHNDAYRSLPADQAARLLGLGRDLRPEATAARDFLETAEIVAGLDLVVTVDTSVAHLAGSMGVPTWVLLPAFGADWRWPRGGASSPWYPAARPYRQPEPGQWSCVVDRVVRDAAVRLR